ncbi:MAG: hypothetical protein U5L45_00585 [Saprospiraceae bacterium]|nr:hypothetical protein [Saprospiraceae bacterium]
MGIKRRESHHIDEYVPLENVAVSTFLEQGTSPVSYLDTEMMSGELTAENLSVLLDKGYVFTYLELKPHYVNWTFKLYDLLYKTRHGIDYFLKINHFNNYYVLGLSYYK